MLWLGFRHMRQGVRIKCTRQRLPARTQHPSRRPLQPFMRVGDHQPYASYLAPALALLEVDFGLCLADWIMR